MFHGDSPSQSNNFPLFHNRKIVGMGVMLTLLFWLSRVKEERLSPAAGPFAFDPCAVRYQDGPRITNHQKRCQAPWVVGNPSTIHKANQIKNPQTCHLSFTQTPTIEIYSQKSRAAHTCGPLAFNPHQSADV